MGLLFEEQDYESDALDAPWWLVTVVFAGWTAGLLVVYWAIWQFASQWIMVSPSEILTSRGTVSEALGRVWFIFVWAAGFTLFMGLVSIAKGYRREHEFYEYFVKGGWISINAGVFEEIIFRWLSFFTALIGLQLFNAVTKGLVEWVYTTLLVPFANWATLSQLEPYLYDPRSWVVGAAIISANGKFRDGHAYQGWFGWVNAWFGGMVMFWLAFNYGLWAAICAHVLYDLIIDWSMTFVSMLQDD